MQNIVIPQTEYRQLRKQAIAYRKLASKLFESIVHDPIDEVVADFRKTDLYSKGFLIDLESGLRRSSYPKREL